MAIGSGTNFTPLEGSTFANGVATGAVPHFTSFTVMVVDGKLVVPPSATCTDMRTSFVACGGDPKGTWTYDTYCPPVSTGSGGGGADPFNGRCKGWSLTSELDIVADVTIDATTITSSGLTLNGTTHTTVPLSCMNDLPDGGTYDSGINDCAAVQNALFTPKDGGAPTSTCVDEASVCKCTGTGSQSFPAEAPQTYTISGSSITSTDSKGKVTTTEFCVKGDTITSRIPGATAAEDTFYTLKRK